MNIGDKAPEILGKDENGQEIRLSDFKGRKLVLYFYPKDNTSGCTAEACSLRDAVRLRLVVCVIIMSRCKERATKWWASARIQQPHTRSSRRSMNFLFP